MWLTRFLVANIIGCAVVSGIVQALNRPRQQRTGSQKAIEGPRPDLDLKEER